MLKGKTVLLGVTGGIAAYKAAALASALVKLGGGGGSGYDRPCHPIYHPSDL